MQRFRATLGLALLLGMPAYAQDVQNFKPAPGTWNYLSVEGAETAPEGRFVPSLYVNYGRNPLVRRDENDEVTDEIVGHMVTADLMAIYGVLDWLDLGVAIPVGYVDGEDIDTLGGDAGFALGDVRLLSKARLPLDRDGTFGLALALPITVPSGDASRGQGGDALVIEPKLIGEVRGYGVSLAANLGYRYRTSNEAVEDLELGNEISYGAAASVELGSPDWLLLGEVFGKTPAEDAEGNNKPLEGLLAGRLFTGWGGVFTLGGGLGIVADAGSPDYRILGGFAFHRRHEDADGDGIVDGDDGCPQDPEDKDDFEDADGCPDPDNDQDGIPDASDQCPNQAESINGVDDDDGCPEGDRDGDGVLDAQDQCPEEPEDPDGFEDADGCPDPDNDQDGIADTEDKCPVDAEDADEFEDADGCPDPDNDKDGIPDVDDQCPLEPETINGNEDDDGCPDVGEAKVQVTREKIEILEKVYFETGRARIREESHDVLNQVASVLKANPQIVKLRIEGHTDTRGAEATNEWLSKERARQVRQYLVDRGIDPERLVSEGYGESRPLDPAENEEAWAKNRRVEFVIVREGEDAGQEEQEEEGEKKEQPEQE